MEQKKHIKRNKKSGKKILLLFATVIIIVLLIVFIPKMLNKNNSDNNNKVDNLLIGLWSIDGYTDYEFNKDGKGKMITPLKDYPFTYKTENNQLFIDFENETSKDSTYEFSFEDEKMIWKNLEETYLIFTFTRK